MLIIAISLISGASWFTVVYDITLSWVWVVGYLSGALVATTYKWSFFVFGTSSTFSSPPLFSTAASPPPNCIWPSLADSSSSGCFIPSRTVSMMVETKLASPRALYSGVS
ncbi:hypothetical protein BJ878DRAFT_239014 [Calycina marina]|uniref:Uncharacterized protein n=1 Tax=Calycina marina TaxID=1763456 RepID=A0A9P7Z8Q6_9HELO|nr:hypothetical protein BJ878DRAFT_239014 [Calycina marina]